MTDSLLNLVYVPVKFLKSILKDTMYKENVIQSLVSRGKILSSLAQKSKLSPSCPAANQPLPLPSPEDDWSPHRRSSALWQGSCMGGINVHEERLAFVHKSCQKAGLHL